MRRSILLIPLLLSFLSVPVAAEGPTDGTCDAIGVLVCAGANAGANAWCSITPAGVASCGWTRGAIWTAYSPVGLPGDAAVETTWTLTTCVNSSCAPADGGSDADACSWVGILSCDGEDGGSGSVGPIQLVLGECFKVLVEETIHVEARVATGGPTMATAAWTDAGDAGGQVCFVDDGRGG
jgi:hypothetical protein